MRQGRGSHADIRPALKFWALTVKLRIMVYIPLGSPVLRCRTAPDDEPNWEVLQCTNIRPTYLTCTQFHIANTIPFRPSTPHMMVELGSPLIHRTKLRHPPPGPNDLKGPPGRLGGSGLLEETLDSPDLCVAFRN